MNTIGEHKVSRFLILALSLAMMLVSCSEKEKIVEVPVEVPADCPPSPPRDLTAFNLDGYVTLSWSPNPETDVRYYDVYRCDDVVDGEPADDFIYVGTIEDTYPLQDPSEYWYDEAEYLINGKPYAYTVIAVDDEGLDSTEPFDGYVTEWVIATPRYEGIVTLYDVDTEADSSGFDLDDVNVTKAQAWDDETTDIYLAVNGGRLELKVDFPAVMIQDYGFAGYDLDGFDYASLSPLDGWSPTGTAEVILGHVYFIRFGNVPELNYAKIWVQETTSNSVTFYWAYQSGINNRQLSPGLDSGGEESDAKVTAAAPKLFKRKEAETTKTYILNGRQYPPTEKGNMNAEDNL